jgi:aspartyl-tRNA(Asn)/glutamyl-tRNA(Gln) amidotransferase subunit C
VPPNFGADDPALGYAAPMTDRLSLDEVRHVAKLARLRLTDEQLQQYRGQLSTILDHIAKLEALDVEGVEPMAHPGDLTNRLDADEVGAMLDLEQVLSIAPATESQFLAVPKVLTDEEGS